MLYHTLSILVHNQCSYFELVSPIYFGHNTIWLKFPSQKVDSNTIAEVNFGQNAIKREFLNVLIYKLQRKRSLRSDIGDTFTEATSTSLQLLVIWKAYFSSIFYVRALLIKHSSAITWNEDTLEKLHSMYLALLKENQDIKDTWLLNDTTVLMTTSEWKTDYTLKITISEETRKDDSMEPLWISSNM
jgi:hypothetical protein